MQANSQVSESLRPNHKERLKSLKNAVDEDGNLYSFGEEDKICLRKKNTREDLPIGRIKVGERNLLYYKWEDERNIFQKTEAWSINYVVFEQVDNIIYETTKYSYTIPRQRAIEFGEVLKFNGEKKIYIPIKYWDKRRTLIDPIENRRRNLFGDSWYELLKDVINSEYMSTIGNYLRKRRTEILVYPEEENVFRALKLTHLRQVKVVVLGQEPYIDGSANGLAFGFKTSSQKRPSKSLDVIFKEVERDVYKGFHLDLDDSLVSWADQGVLLLNTILTVEKQRLKSHESLGWQRFIKIILYELLMDADQKVFMLWGNDAQALFEEVNAKQPTFHHLVLKSKHPAADLYGKDQFGDITPNYPSTFSGNKHFSQANQFLINCKRKPIKW